VREALFSILQARGCLGEGKRILDLYAGSGALAFEALSRGASSAVVVEQARDPVTVIRENAHAFGASERVTIVPFRVEQAFARLMGPFDVVFADPPYAHVSKDAFGAVLGRIAALVAPSGMFVLEHASEDDAPAVAALTLESSRHYGDTMLSFYCHDDR